MTNITQISQLILSIIQDQDLILKTILIILLTLYILFALILTRQIFYFNSIINLVTFSPIFKIIALIHVALATILLIGIVLFV